MTVTALASFPDDEPRPAPAAAPGCDAIELNELITALYLLLREEPEAGR